MLTSGGLYEDQPMPEPAKEPSEMIVDDWASVFKKNRSEKEEEEEMVFKGPDSTKQNSSRCS